MRREPGFVLPAVLVVSALVLTAAAGCLAVALSSVTIARADAEGAAARAAARAGSADLLEAMRWGWVRVPEAGETVEWSESVGDRRVSATVDPEPSVDPAWMPAGSFVGAAVSRAVSVSLRASCGDACATSSSIVVDTGDGLPRGLVVAGDVDLQAPLQLTGCGLEAGGDVSGREWVTLMSPPASLACLPDLAYGGLQATAAVHAAGSIFIAGHEEHDDGAGIEGDGDRHTGVPAPSSIVAGPVAATVASLVAHAQQTPSPVALEAISPVAAVSPPEATTLPGRGRLVTVRPTAGPCLLHGERPPPPAACPVTVVVTGDAVVDAPTALTGVLVVEGRLEVRAPLRVRGSVFATALDVVAPISVEAVPVTGQDSAPGVSEFRSTPVKA
jgi:type II secretory pathway pseudopilin PulG